MLPHKKPWTKEQILRAQKLFDEGQKQRELALKSQNLSAKQIKEKLKCA